MLRLPGKSEGELVSVYDREPIPGLWYRQLNQTGSTRPSYIKSSHWATIHAKNQNGNQVFGFTKWIMVKPGVTESIKTYVI